MSTKLSGTSRVPSSFLVLSDYEAFVGGGGITVHRSSWDKAAISLVIHGGQTAVLVNIGILGQRAALQETDGNWNETLQYTCNLQDLVLHVPQYVYAYMQHRRHLKGILNPKNQCKKARPFRLPKTDSFHKYLYLSFGILNTKRKNPQREVNFYELVNVCETIRIRIFWKSVREDALFEETLVSKGSSSEDPLVRYPSETRGSSRK